MSTTFIFSLLILLFPTRPALLYHSISRNTVTVLLIEGDASSEQLKLVSFLASVWLQIFQMFLVPFELVKWKNNFEALAMNVRWNHAPSPIETGKITWYSQRYRCKISSKIKYLDDISRLSVEIRLLSTICRRFEILIVSVVVKNDTYCVKIVDFGQKWYCAGHK